MRIKGRFAFQALAACVVALGVGPASGEMPLAAGEAIIPVREVDWLELQLQVTALMNSDARRSFLLLVKRNDGGYHIDAELAFERYDEFLRFRMTSRRGICEENIQSANEWIQATVNRVAPRIRRTFRVLDDVTWRVVGSEAGKTIPIGSWKKGQFSWAQK